MIEFAGLVFSGVSTLTGLAKEGYELISWSDQDLLVDAEWLPLALEQGVLDGKEEDYRWVRLHAVPTTELSGKLVTVIAYNKDSRTKGRLVRGIDADPLILMKKP